MINDLERFSVERLEDLAKSDSERTWFFRVDELRALARIALAAKSAVPAYWITYYPNPDPNEFDDREHSHSGKLCAVRIAKEIGGFVVPVYHGATCLVNPPLIPDGYKLVPIEPSLKMMEAAVTCEDASFDTESDMVCIHHEIIYKAMLAAAPAPEEL